MVAVCFVLLRLHCAVTFLTGLETSTCCCAPTTPYLAIQSSRSGDLVYSTFLNWNWPLFLASFYHDGTPIWILDPRCASLMVGLAPSLSFQGSLGPSNMPPLLDVLDLPWPPLQDVLDLFWQPCVDRWSHSCATPVATPSPSGVTPVKPSTGPDFGPLLLPAPCRLAKMRSGIPYIGRNDCVRWEEGRPLVNYQCKAER